MKKFRVIVQEITNEEGLSHGEPLSGTWTPIGWWLLDLQNGDLLNWWVDTAMNDFKTGAPKVDEYGAHDLEIMGVVLSVFAGMEKTLANPHALDALPVGTELACWFYVLGKVARLVSDYLAKRPGKADTWHDITFYSMMARRIQETGRWP